ncbi:DoxX family protein [Enhygromyxa salina]|uniref:DoxX-like family protein n=1 Tax=Enhygromyxa salina TaxID=215803 RepID=A0A2S9XTA9_9BACT|nr:DoxX family protein [Enhygromyxa salina]PRP96107.1 hypothetical protein ENSA7_69210 [Enhygromyxa salina]
MSDNSKGKVVGYWITTAILAVLLLAAGFMDLMGQPEVTESLQRLGYPMYLAALLGTVKLLAAIAILAPNYARLKEWAYAGVVFIMTGAIYSHIRMDEAEQTLMPMLLLLLAFGSWYLRPPSRKLPDLIPIK